MAAETEPCLWDDPEVACWWLGAAPRERALAYEVWLIASSAVPNQFVTYPVLDAALIGVVPAGEVSMWRDVWVATWTLVSVELDVGGVLVRAVIWPGVEWVPELVAAVEDGHVDINDRTTRAAWADPRRYQRG